MKVNKKAILGMLAAMVMSLGMMSGLNINSSKKDCNLSQVSLGTAYSSAYAESAGGQATCVTISTIAGCGAAYFYKGAIVAAATGAGTPVALASGLLGVICTF
ncbi:MAG: hypothetical protein LBR13_01400 [Dysgonamonadaceae bacterium]|jgi:hypothetical protein|nr:hypothetical protein [Dysgonamonadaceae bacterium]